MKILRPTLDSLYARLPVSLQNAACTLEGWKQNRLRHGGVFSERLEWLERSQWWTAAQIEEYQSAQVRTLITHCHEKIPYYHQMFAAHGLDPNSIRSRKDLRRIPVLTKETVRRNHSALLAKGSQTTDLFHAHTSGSTGKAMSFFVEHSLVQFRWAVWWRHRHRFGVPFGAPFAVFTGKTAVPIDTDKPPYWRVNRAMNQTIFSMQQVVPDKIGAIVGRLNEGGFTYYSGYPSILFSLAQMIEAAGLNLTRPPKVIFTGAEKLFTFQRDVMERVFHCPVTDQYGFSEGCGNASRCEHDRFHEDFEFGVLDCHEPEQVGPGIVRGKIIATGFAGRAFPFVRYEVGDVGIWSSGGCACGRHSRVLLEVEGRQEDYVLTPEGSRIQRFDYLFKASERVAEAQVIQDALDHIVIKVVPRPGYGEEDEQMLRDQVRKMISPTLRVTISPVCQIERTSTGKFRAVISTFGSS